MSILHFHSQTLLIYKTIKKNGQELSRWLLTVLLYSTCTPALQTLLTGILSHSMERKKRKEQLKCARSCGRSEDSKTGTSPASKLKV